MAFRKLLLLLIFFEAGLLPAQEFLIVNNLRELYRVNMEDCSAQYVSSIQITGGGSISDITYTRDGQLWGITTDGRLYAITENSGSTVLVHTMPTANAPFYTSLVADGEGRIYAAGGNGDLYFYDLNTMADTYLGNIGHGSAGDLTFYQGQLIMASTTNQMINVDLEEPANSSVRLNFNAGGQIFGIVTFVEDCDNTVTYATNDAGNGIAFEVDFETGQLSQVCALGTLIFGAASRLEFLAANPIEIEAVNTTPTTCTSPQGVIELVATGGNGPLMYALDSINFQSSPIFTALFPGDYTVYIQDGQSCSASQVVTVGAIGEPPVITSLSLQEDSCGLGIGAILVEAEGGLPPYQYMLDGASPVDSPHFTGLSAGQYWVSVIDDRDCRDVQSITLPGEPAPSIDRVGIKPCGPGRSSLAIDASGGTGMLLYSFNEAPGQPSPEFTGLDAGFYRLGVVDEAGCSDTQLVEIPPSTALAFMGVDIKACGQDSSSLTVAAQGGTGPLIFSLGHGLSQSTGSFDNLSAGAYTLMVTDEYGCTIDSSIHMPEYTRPQIINIEITPSRCGDPNAEARLEVAEGTAPYVYQLDEKEQTTPEFKGLAPGSFLLSIFDARGCISTETIEIGQLCPVYIPNAFSPNGDGRNDRFKLHSGAAFQILNFRIFNRWGTLVYDQSNFYSSDTALFWDGRVNNEPAPVGVYAFYVEVINAMGEKEFFEGEIILVR